MKPKLYITGTYVDKTINGGNKIEYSGTVYYTQAKTAVYMFISFALGVISGMYILVKGIV